MAVLTEMSNTKSSVRIKRDLSETFATKRGFRQGDTLSCDFFTPLLEKIVRAEELNRKGTIFYKSVKRLSYADNIDIIGHNNHTVTSVFFRLNKEAKQEDLVGEVKTKYLLSPKK